MPVGLASPGKLLPVKGIKLSAIAAGLRYKNRPDLVLMVCEEDASVAATFTANRYAAAPVIVARDHLADNTPRAFIINAGQANAGTGQAGIDVSQQSCTAVAGALGCGAEQVLPFSTGVIGAPPPLDKLVEAIPGLVSSLADDNWNQAAEGIMTTDTVAKGCSQQFELGGVTATVTGIAKGSGMIHPNMATMLAYVGTDAAIDQSLLRKCWQEVIATTFNRITVDGDTSTNDAAVIIATGEAGNSRIGKRDSDDYAALREALRSVCLTLAQSIIRDAEGATKFVTIRVDGGSSEQDCLDVAFAVAHSLLVKTALFASDPNWGRILAVVGRAPIAELDIDKVDLYLDDVCVARHGAIADDYTEEKGQEVMDREELTIGIDLNSGEYSASVWTSDLSHEYVRINAEYRS